MIAGKGPSPKLVVALIKRLPDTSMTSALASGGMDHFGWGTDRHLYASIYDAINLNTRATGNWAKGKAPKFDPFPRPKASKEEKKRVTLKDIWQRLQSRR